MYVATCFYTVFDVIRRRYLIKEEWYLRILSRGVMVFLERIDSVKIRQGQLIYLLPKCQLCLLSPVFFLHCVFVHIPPKFLLTHKGYRLHHLEDTFPCTHVKVNKLSRVVQNTLIFLPGQSCRFHIIYPAWTIYTHILKISLLAHQNSFHWRFHEWRCLSVSITKIPLTKTLYRKFPHWASDYEFTVLKHQ